jgi:hypothetical protein
MSIRGSNLLQAPFYFVPFHQICLMFFVHSVPACMISPSYFIIQPFYMYLCPFSFIWEFPYMVMLLITCKHAIDHQMLTQASQCLCSHLASPDCCQNRISTPVGSSSKLHYYIVVVLPHNHYYIRVVTATLLLLYLTARTGQG